MQRNITTIDLTLAAAFFPILVEAASVKQTISYRALVDEARMRHPGNAVVSNAIPVGVGRRLEVLRSFTEQHGMPDLASLVVNEVTKEVGTAYSDAFDPVSQRAAVFAFDWTDATIDFGAHVKAAGASLPKPIKRITRAVAKARMSTFASVNRDRLAPGAVQARDRILELLTDGNDEETAFAAADALKV